MGKIETLCANEEKEISRELLLDIYQWLGNQYGGINESAWITMPAAGFEFELFAEKKGLFPNRLLCLEKLPAEFTKIQRKIKSSLPNKTIELTHEPMEDLEFFQNTDDFGRGFCFVWLDYMGPIIRKYAYSLMHIAKKARSIFNLAWEDGRPGMLTITLLTRRGGFDYFREVYEAFGYNWNSWIHAIPDQKINSQINLLSHYLNKWGKAAGVSFQPLHSNNYKGGKSSPMLITSFAVLPTIEPTYPLFGHTHIQYNEFTKKQNFL